MAKRKPPRADLWPWVVTLNRWIADKNWSGADFIRELGEKEWKERVYKYLRGGVEDPGIDVFNALAKPFGRTGLDLELGRLANVTNSGQIPLIPMNETGTLASTRKTPEMWSGETVDVSESIFSDQLFATIAEDNSCAPKIEAGDKLIVDLGATLEPGDFILAIVAKRENGVVCRKFRPLSSDDEAAFRLVGTNEDFPPIDIHGPEDGSVIGRIVEVRKKL